MTPTTEGSIPSPSPSAPSAHERLFEFSTDLLCVASYEGYFLHLNPAWERVLGWSLEELKSRPLIEFVHPEDRAATERESEVLRSQGRIVAFENRYLCKDGTTRNISWNSTASGGFSYGVGRDVTEQRRLEELQLLLASIVHSSQDAIVAYNLDGVIMSWNPSAERIFGYKAEAILGRHIGLLVPPEYEGEPREMTARILQGETIEHYETERVRRDGSRVPVSLTISPIQVADGTIIGASASARDITIRRRLQAELARHAEELERSNAELEQFAYAVSHDLQEPLRSVSNFSQFLLEDQGEKLPPDAQDHLRRIVQGARRMNDMIKAMLRVARAGREVEAPSLVDVTEVIDEVREAVDARLRERDGRIEVVSELPKLVAHRVRLLEIFSNLIGNGLKFNETERPIVRIGCQRKENGYEFFVEDNGIGIAEEHWDQLFKLFRRLNAREKYPGTGAGLAIVAKNVHSSGGRIWIEKGSLGGARFVFTLPGPSPSPQRPPKAREATANPARRLRSK